MIIDFLRQKMVNKLGGWNAATKCHLNTRIYKAKCQVIDNLPLEDLAKAKFEEISGVTGRVPASSNSNAVPAQQATLSLDDII